jgi:hypothetical protein
MGTKNDLLFGTALAVVMGMLLLIVGLPIWSVIVLAFAIGGVRVWIVAVRPVLRESRQVESGPAQPPHRTTPSA